MAPPKLKAQYVNWNSQSGSGKRTQNKYARFSDIAYAQNIKAKQELLKKHDPSGTWKLDDKLTTRDATVFKSTKTGEVVVAVRGTDLNAKDTRWRDIASDVGIALGVSKFGRRNSSIRKLVKQVESKYNKKPVLTGHSLGGRVAADVARSDDLKAIVYNQGSSPVDSVGGIISRLAKLVGLKSKKGDVEHYHTNKGTRVDPVSVSAAVLEDGEAVDGKADVNAHALDNFIDDGEQIGEGKRTVNPWIAHVRAYRKKHPKLSYRQCLSAASKTYKK